MPGPIERSPAIDSGVESPLQQDLLRRPAQKEDSTEPFEDILERAKKEQQEKEEQESE
jgi:hypothetical protein